MSLDAGLRMDGIPALPLWDLVIEIFHSVPNKIEQPKEELRTKPNMHNHFQSSTPTSFQQTLITFHQIQRILILMLCCMCLKTTKQ